MTQLITENAAPSAFFPFERLPEELRQGVLTALSDAKTMMSGRLVSRGFRDSVDRVMLIIALEDSPFSGKTYEQRSIALTGLQSLPEDLFYRCIPVPRIYGIMLQEFAAHAPRASVVYPHLQLEAPHLGSTSAMSAYLRREEWQNIILAGLRVMNAALFWRAPHIISKMAQSKLLSKDLNLLVSAFQKLAGEAEEIANGDIEDGVTRWIRNHLDLNTPFKEILNAPSLADTLSGDERRAFLWCVGDIQGEKDFKSLISYLQYKAISTIRDPSLDSKVEEQFIALSQEFLQIDPVKRFGLFPREVFEEAVRSRTLVERQFQDEQSLENKFVALMERIELKSVNKRDREILRFLKLESFLITTLPVQACIREQIKEIHLQNQALVTVPPEIKYCHDLHYLDLRGNHLTSLPREFEDLSSLEYLDLSYNPELKSLPSLRGLTSLACIVLSVGQLSYFFPRLTELAERRTFKIMMKQRKVEREEDGTIFKFEEHRACSSSWLFPRFVIPSSLLA